MRVQCLLVWCAYLLLHSGLSLLLLPCFLLGGGGLLLQLLWLFLQLKQLLDVHRWE